MFNYVSGIHEFVGCLQKWTGIVFFYSFCFWMKILEFLKTVSTSHTCINCSIKKIILLLHVAAHVPKILGGSSILCYLGRLLSVNV